MTGDFKFVRKIKFRLHPDMFVDVYYDRFNSIFKGHYIVVDSHNLSNTVKVPSTERFGSQDVEYFELVPKDQLTPEQIYAIGQLNQRFAG
ncbi:MAG: hypothetical protein LBS99_05725 [Clostridiales bacterium]|nr:hypothetical protein [Clostridiales bacterium]